MDYNHSDVGKVYVKYWHELRLQKTELKVKNDQICQKFLNLSTVLTVKINTDVIGSTYGEEAVDNQELIKINDALRNHPVEIIGKELRASMTAMKKIV